MSRQSLANEARAAVPPPPADRRVMTAQKLPPALVAEVRAAAALEGITWTAVVEEGLRKYVRAAARRQHQADVAAATGEV